MLSVVIPTLNSDSGLPATLAALIPGVVDDVVHEVVIADGGSRDRTLEIADHAGATLISCQRGRGRQLSEGARHARGDWLLFLHADTVLEPGWVYEARNFMNRVDSGDMPMAAAAFRFALDDYGLKPRAMERMVAYRCALFGLPYGDQGLLIPRRLYESAGGFRALPLMEDVDLVRRLGKRRIKLLRSAAVTSAVRYKTEGYIARTVRNLACLSLFFMRVPARTLVKIYG